MFGGTSPRAIPTSFPSAPGSGVPAGVGNPGLAGTSGVAAHSASDVSDGAIGGGSLDPAGLSGSGTPGLDSAHKNVIVEDGDRTITVGQPDAQGHSTVTVEGGRVGLREYTVDFTGGSGEQPESGVIAARGGAAVIHDGDTAISLEQVPGPTDRLRMTVDDGTPTSYDVDFGPDSHLAGTPDAAGSQPDGAGRGSAGGHIGSDGVNDSRGAGSGGTGSGGAGGGSDSGGAGSGGTGHGGTGGGSGGGTGGGGGGGTSGTSAGGGDLQPGLMTGVGSQGATSAELAGVASDAGADGPAGSGRGSGGPTAFGGMPLGGMGAGQGGDQTRQGGSKWRTTGQLFDDPDPAANFGGVVGRDPAEKAKPNPKH